MGTKIGICTVALSLSYGAYQLLTIGSDWGHFGLVAFVAVLGAVVWAWYRFTEAVESATFQAPKLESHPALAAPKLPTFTVADVVIVPSAEPFAAERDDGPAKTMLPPANPFLEPPRHPAQVPVWNRRQSPPHLTLVHDNGQPVASNDFRKRVASAR